MLRPEESPTELPPEISVTPNTSLTRPNVPFIVSDGPETNVLGSPNNSGMTTGVRDGSSSSSASLSSNAEVVPANIPEPPAIKPKPPVRIISKGVINGQAKSLPPPPYPAPARMVNAEGKVSVQITIDETGKVISSKAIDGHPLLKGAAEKAAWNAKFSPTYLSEVPVKVTGVIVYNFKRN
jgi:TonB family protein